VEEVVVVQLVDVEVPAGAHHFEAALGSAEASKKLEADSSIDFKILDRCFYF
jgi:hypothetical protein